MRDRDKARIIRSAIKDLHSNESLERALGRCVRNAHGTYEDYLEIIGAIRDLSRKRKTSLLEAARDVAKSYEV